MGDRTPIKETIKIEQCSYNDNLPDVKIQRAPILTYTIKKGQNLCQNVKYDVLADFPAGLYIIPALSLTISSLKLFKQIIEDFIVEFIEKAKLLQETEYIDKEDL